MTLTLLRSASRTALFVALLLATCLDGQIRKLFFGLRPGPEGAIWVHHWCRRIVRILGIPCDVAGPLPIATGRGLAVVSNHLSYLDILIYSAATPFIMVAKSEVRQWPLLGWITAQAGTVYVQRADVKGGQTQTHAQVDAAMAHAYRSGLPVLFFPEGTTTDGSHVLPFRRGLYHSILADGIPVKTAALTYTLEEPNPNASVADDVCFSGAASFAPHLFRCLGLRGLRASIRFDQTEVEGIDRFELAINSQHYVRSLYTRLQATAWSSYAPSAPTEKLTAQS
jgi:1-acyl-sn-glycerol-3-phosphate acyltransferase